MEQIIKFISEKIGVSESVVREAVKVLLQFAQKQAAGTQFEKFMAQIPGASALAAEAPVAGGEPAGGLLGSVGSLFGGKMGDAAKAFAGLQAAGLETSQIGPFVQAFVEKAREVAGPETVDAILKKVPMLDSFLKPKV